MGRQIFENIMAENFSNFILELHQPIHLIMIAIIRQDKYKKNQNSVYDSQIAENQRKRAC